MAAIKAAVIGVAGALICSMLRQRPEMRLGVVIATGLCVVVFCLDGLRESVSLIDSLGQGEDASAMIRASGIALVTEFAAQLCRDAEEGTLATRVEMAGRVAILGIAAPLLTALVAQMGGLAA